MEGQGWLVSSYPSMVMIPFGYTLSELSPVGPPGGETSIWQIVLPPAILIATWHRDGPQAALSDCLATLFPTSTGCPFVSRNCGMVMGAPEATPPPPLPPPPPPPSLPELPPPDVPLEPEFPPDAELPAPELNLASAPGLPVRGGGWAPFPGVPAAPGPPLHPITARHPASVRTAHGHRRKRAIVVIPHRSPR
jgi:hypothetical protein